MFNVEKYIKVAHTGLKRNNDGRVTWHIDVNIDDDKISKEVEELRENLLNLHKILGYDFSLTVSENKIKFERLQ